MFEAGDLVYDPIKPYWYGNENRGEICPIGRNGSGRLQMTLGIMFSFSETSGVRMERQEVMQYDLRQ
jgi:hypothetical protein